MGDIEQYKQLLQYINSHLPQINKVAPLEGKSPYVISIFGWKGNGKSSLVNTIAQAVKNSPLLETIATTSSGLQADSSNIPRLYTLRPDRLYIADFPGWSLRFIRDDLSAIDTESPITYFREQLYDIGQVCADNQLRGTISGVAIFVVDARDCIDNDVHIAGSSSNKAQKFAESVKEHNRLTAKREASKEVLKIVRKDIDFVVALTHWDDIHKDKQKETISAASKILNVDNAHIFPVSNYMGFTESNYSQFTRNYAIEVPILHLVNAAMLKIDQSGPIIAKLIRDKLVRVPQYDLEIISARYYAVSKPVLGRDVTDIVKGFLKRAVERKQSNISFSATNQELGGDPVRWYPKALELQYYYRFEKKTTKYSEHDKINLP